MAAFRRFIPSMLAFLAQVVLQVSGYQSVILATILLVLMVVLAVMGGWTWLKRWRPFTLVPEDGDFRQSQETERLRSENERLKADKTALEKELEKARSAADKMGKGTTSTDRADRSTSATPAETPAMPAVPASSNPTIGETVSMESGARLTVHSYEVPVPVPAWYQQQLTPGYELSAIDVEAYAGSNPEDYLDHIQSSDFKLQMQDSIRLTPALSVKKPALLNNPLDHGDNIRGWISFEVPKDEKPKFVVYSRRRSVVKWAIP